GQGCHSGAMASSARSQPRCARGGVVWRVVRRGPWASSGLCDDEGVPLICPTCQVLAQSVLAGDRLLTLHGVVFDIFVGSHSEAARLRDSCLKAHTPTGPSLYRNGAPRPMKMGTTRSL